jgi:hypothetical protein
MIKKIIKIVIISVVVLLVCRGPIYRSLVTYKSVGVRHNYKIHDINLIDYIETNKKTNIRTVEDVIKNSLSITSNKLNFTVNKNDNDPNKLIISKNAHCVGYAAFFSSTCNYLLKKNNLNDDWVAKPQIGHLYLLNNNIHKLFKSSFFKDHDFVLITNKKTGESFSVDPTVDDYLYIDIVS